MYKNQIYQKKISTIFGYDYLELKKILDSNILIYSLFEDHPAAQVCEEYILSCENKFEWVTSPITFYETFYVLVKFYGLESSQVFKKIKETMKLPIDIKPLDKSLIITSLGKIIKHQIDTNDSILLQIGINYGISILATDDKKLIKACEDYGIICENPITEDIRKKIVDWEEKNLPKKGVGRIYSRIYNWIAQRDKELADEFQFETKEFTRIL